jgi:hypothetical protein
LQSNVSEEKSNKIIEENSKFMTGALPLQVLDT